MQGFDACAGEGGEHGLDQRVLARMLMGVGGFLLLGGGEAEGGFFGGEGNGPAAAGFLLQHRAEPGGEVTRGGWGEV